MRPALIATAIALTLGSAAAAPALAQRLPVREGRVLRYVGHAFGQPDRETWLRIERADSLELAFVWETELIGGDGASHPYTIRRVMSRRELDGARTVDLGRRPCPRLLPDDTAAARRRGSVFMAISRRAYRQLVRDGSTVLSTLLGPTDCAPFEVRSSTFRLTGRETLSINLGGGRLTLPALRLKGGLGTAELDLTILDDEAHPWLLRLGGLRVDGTDYLVELVGIDEPQTGVEETLARECRARVDGIYFESNSAQLNAASKATLETIARTLRHHPEWTVTIEGHTDSIGGAAFNRDLSARRAEAARQALIRDFGIGADRVKSVGFGLERPVDNNRTVEGRARNRRVELTRQCPAKERR